MVFTETAIQPVQAGELVKRDPAELHALESGLLRKLDNAQLTSQERASIEAYLTNIQRARAVILSDEGEF